MYSYVAIKKRSVERKPGTDGGKRFTLLEVEWGVSNTSLPHFYTSSTCNASGTQSHSLASYIRENIPQIRNYMTSPRSVVIVSFCICEIDSCKHIFGYCYFIIILCLMLR